jgi:choline dehydrogenase-like flavoprotein
MAMNCVEEDFQRKIASEFPTRRAIVGRCAHLTQPTVEQQALGRSVCQYRTMCDRGCSFGAYFSSLSATLPAARQTGNLTIITDAIVSEIVYDAQTRQASAVRVIDTVTKTGLPSEADLSLRVDHRQCSDLA